MKSYGEHLARLQFKAAVRDELKEHLGKCEEVRERIALRTRTSLIKYVEGLERLHIKVMHLPLWPTQEHIDGMIKKGVLLREDCFIWEDEWKKFSKNPNVPQAVGYQICSYNELERVITDPDALAEARRRMVNWEGYPIIYLWNHNFLTEWAKYLGGRLPEQDEQLEIWNKLTGKTVLHKAKHAGIPFLGCFHDNKCKFLNVGDWAYLLSNTQSDHPRARYESNIWFYFMSLERGNRDEKSNQWDFHQNAYSGLIVQDKV